MVLSFHLNFGLARLAVGKTVESIHIMLGRLLAMYAKIFLHAFLSGVVVHK